MTTRARWRDAARSNAPSLSFYKWVEQYDFTAQSRSTAAICMVLQVGKMVLLTAARSMHEFFQIWDLLSMQIWHPANRAIQSNSQKTSFLVLLTSSQKPRSTGTHYPHIGNKVNLSFFLCGQFVPKFVSRRQSSQLGVSTQLWGVSFIWCRVKIDYKSLSCTRIDRFPLSSESIQLYPEIC